MRPCCCQHLAFTNNTTQRAQVNTFGNSIHQARSYLPNFLAGIEFVHVAPTVENMLVTEKGRWQAASFLWLLCGCTSCLAVSSNAGVGCRMGHGPAVARLRGGDGDIREIAGVSCTVDARPAPGNPFHLAFPVHDLEAARTFWGGVLKCKQGRELSGGTHV